MLPNFVIIGAGKAGTTSLYHYLDQHPEIYMCPLKEPRFFSAEGLILEELGEIDNRLNRLSIRDIDAYSRLFKDVTIEKAIGEASQNYLTSKKAPERLANYIPKAKIIAILRDPIERAFAHYVNFFRSGYEKESDFVRLLKKGDVSRNRYIIGGFYNKSLSNYLKYFQMDQIKIYIYEKDFLNKQSQFMKDIFRFVGVDDNLKVDTSKRYNVSGLPKNKYLLTVFRSATRLKPLVKKTLPLLWVSPLAELSHWVTKKLVKKPVLPAEAREWLAEIYREDVMELQELLQRDLSSWLSR